MLAADRAILETHCAATGRPLEQVKRWFRKLDDTQRDRVRRNLEVVQARRERGLVGPDEVRAPGLILPGGI